MIIQENESRYQTKQLAQISVIIIALLLIALIVISIWAADLAIGDEMLKYSLISGLLYLYILIIGIFIAWRLFSIDLNYADQQENSDCFQSVPTLLGSILMNEDYTVWRWIGQCFTFINFVVSAQSARRQDPLHLEIDIIYYIFIVLVGTQIIFGIFISFYVFGLLIQLCSDFKEFDKDLVYYVHIQTQFQNEIQHRKKTITQTFKFCCLCLVYYCFKIILMIALIDNSIASLMGYIIFLSLSSIFLLLKILLFLDNQLELLETQAEQQLFDLNTECFNSWFILLKSIMRSRNFRYWKLYLTVLLLGQAIFGQISLPISAFLTIQNDTSYNIQSYIYADCLLVIYALISIILIQISRFYHGISGSPPILANDQIQQIQVLPNNDQSISRNHRLVSLPPLSNQQQNQPIDSSQLNQLGECCFCLEQMNPNSKLKQLRCHPQHIFHHYCISKWLVNNRTCPLCQKEAI